MTPERIKAVIEVLDQVEKAGKVEAGDLVDKPTTRNLVDKGFLRNTYGSSGSALGTISLSVRGQAFIGMINILREEWR